VAKFFHFDLGLFQVWAVIPLIFLFALAQTPLILKHEIRADAEE